MTKHHNTPIDRDTQERMRRKYDGGGKEVRDWRHDPRWDRQGPGLRLRTEGGGGGVGSRNGRLRKEPRREYPKGLTGMIDILREDKGRKPDVMQVIINSLAAWG